MLDLDATTVVDLPVDQLALRILADFQRSGVWNSSNYVIEAQQYRGYSGEALRAIAEAFAWLSARGLTAPNPDQSSAHAIFVTRMGRLVLKDGQDAFYATERLQRGLQWATTQRERVCDRGVTGGDGPAQGAELHSGAASRVAAARASAAAPGKRSPALSNLTHPQGCGEAGRASSQGAW
jgi:hypothetical protein